MNPSKLDAHALESAKDCQQHFINMPLTVSRGEIAREHERDLLQSTHISLWEHSSHDRLIGRGVPGVSFVSR